MKYIKNFWSNVKYGFKTDINAITDVSASLLGRMNLWGREGAHRNAYNSAEVFAIIKPRTGPVTSHRWGIAPGTDAQVACA